MPAGSTCRRLPRSLALPCSLTHLPAHSSTCMDSTHYCTLTPLHSSLARLFSMHNKALALLPRVPALRKSKGDVCGSQDIRSQEAPRGFLPDGRGESGAACAGLVQATDCYRYCIDHSLHEGFEDRAEADAIALLIQPRELFLVQGFLPAKWYAWL